MRRIFGLSAVVIGMSMLMQGCEPSHNFPEETRLLDSLYEEVGSAAERFGEIAQEKTSQTILNIEADLDKIQKTYVGDMPREKAFMLGEYYESKKICKNFDSRYKRLQNEISRTSQQLKDLSGALKTGATQDTEGNQFTEIYVKEVFTQEVSVAKSLITEIDDLKQRVAKLEMKYEELKPQIQELMDSLGIE